MASLSPWNTISETLSGWAAVPPLRMAAKADTMSCAAPYAMPEWIPAPAKTSG
jgi:hypothetical protein